MNNSRGSFMAGFVGLIVTIPLAGHAQQDPLAISCPTGQTVWRCETNPIVTFPLPSTEGGNCRFPATATCVPAPGSIFPLGTNIIHCFATNFCGESASCDFPLIVRRDTNAPLMECPADVSKRTCSPTGAVVTFILPETSDAEDPNPVVVCMPPSGNLFPLGTTTVNCTAVDRCQNRVQCSFNVTVFRDLTPPTVQCPPHVITNTCAPAGIAVTYPIPNASDDNPVMPANAVRCEPPPGRVFPVGITKVVCTAKDLCDNRSSCTFNVTVLGDSALPNVDLNADGIGDIWQINFNTGPLSPLADSDRDGMDNTSEAIAGTDPHNSASRAIIGGFEHKQAGNEPRTITLEWPGVALKSYQIQGTPRLGADTIWIDLGGPRNGANGRMSATLEFDPRRWPELTTNAFLRVRVSDIDVDKDGLSAWEEAILGTSDSDPDTRGTRGGDWSVAGQFAAANPGGPPRLREVTAAHVGGTPDGPTFPVLVTGAGTAGFYKLSSWGIGANNIPNLLAETPPLEGHHIKLQTLTPPETPNLTLNFVASGRIREDHNLWLSIYSVSAAGAFQAIETIGYGANASLRVIDYAMAHRALPKGNNPLAEFQVVTPVIGTNTANMLELRVLTWTVNPVSGNLTATHATSNVGDTNLPTDGGSIQARHLGNEMFVVSYSDRNSVLSSWFFAVSDEGVVSPRGGKASGIDLTGKESVEEGASQFALAELNAHGFSTALIDSTCHIKVAVWEERVVACDAACYSHPFYITDNTEDLNPQVFGVQLDPPLVTDSREKNYESRDYFGAALGAGDFDGDGYADVAIGVQGENDEEGVVNIMYGWANGLTGSFRDQLFAQNTGGIGGNEPDDLYGYALTVGDFNNDGRDDLAIASPRETSNEGIAGIGVVQVLYGSPTGLTIVGEQVWAQGTDGLPGIQQEYDWFGESLTAGDFNGDGYSDLAIGIPREQVGVIVAGAVQIIYGSPVGLTASGNQLLHQDSPSLIGTAEEFDFFGARLAAGDFDGDGHDDLAIGINRETVNGIGDAGAVQVIYGTASGLGTDNNLISQDGFDPGGGSVLGEPQLFGQFGSSLATGDFNNDGRDDLAVGVQHLDFVVDSIENSGAVQIFYGGGSGLGVAGQQMIAQSGLTPGVLDISGVPESFDYFGTALAAGDFDGDGFADLIIGAPGEAVSTNTIQQAGLVHVLRGSANGLAALGNRTFQQGQDGILDVAEEGDSFGIALAAGDFNGDGLPDLAVGAPLETVADGTDDEAEEGGAIHIIFGAGSGLTNAANQIWFQGTERRVRALLTDMQRERDYGTAAGELFVKMPPGEPISNHVASVTKVMTLLLAVEALEAEGSEIVLTDDVTISALAADTRGSHIEPKLETNDVMKLEFLLYAMMLRSCNKSSVAIAQHLTGETEGYGVFTNLMNQKAQQLGMVNTIYTHPAGGCISTPKDMVKLWSNAWLRPLFRQISTARYYTGANACGVDAEGDPKCYFDVPKHSDSGYPGLEGWKGGNGGLGPKMDVPWCTASLLGQATRLDRTLVVSLHQTGDNWGDNDRLLDYGYKRLFTPDYRGGHRLSNPLATDFAVRSITDTLAFTALINTQNQVYVHTWQTVSGIGQVAPLGFAYVTVTNLPPGTHFIPATLVDMTSLPSIEAQREYLSGHLDGGELQLNLWRVDEFLEF